MKHRFTRAEVKHIECVGLDLNRLDGLYEILHPYATATEISMSSAIESVARVTNQFRNITD